MGTIAGLWVEGWSGVRCTTARQAATHLPTCCGPWTSWRRCKQTNTHKETQTKAKEQHFKKVRNISSVRPVGALLHDSHQNRRLARMQQWADTTVAQVPPLDTYLESIHASSAASLEDRGRAAASSAASQEHRGREAQSSAASQTAPAERERRKRSKSNKIQHRRRSTSPAGGGSAGSVSLNIVGPHGARLTTAAQPWDGRTKQTKYNKD